MWAPVITSRHCLGVSMKRLIHFITRKSDQYMSYFCWRTKVLVVHRPRPMLTTQQLSLVDAHLLPQDTYPLFMYSEHQLYLGEADRRALKWWEWCVINRNCIVNATLEKGNFPATFCRERNAFSHWCYLEIAMLAYRIDGSGFESRPQPARLMKVTLKIKSTWKANRNNAGRSKNGWGISKQS